MCGIIGYVGSRPAKDLLLRGLERLEYRGYDSAGLALREDGGLDYVRAVGNLSNLKAAYLGRGDFRSGVRIIGRLRQLAPHDPLHDRDLGACFVQLGQPGKAGIDGAGEVDSESRGMGAHLSDAEGDGVGGGKGVTDG